MRSLGRVSLLKNPGDVLQDDVVYWDEMLNGHRPDRVRKQSLLGKLLAVLVRWHNLFAWLQTNGTLCFVVGMTLESAGR